YMERGIKDDHKLENATYAVSKLVDGQVKMVEEPALTAINMRLRDDYVADCARGVDNWNKVIEKAGVNFKIKLPHEAFHRHAGEFQNIHATPDAKVLSDAEWAKVRDDYLPSKADGDFIQSLMQPQWERGKYAAWIAP